MSAVPELNTQRPLELIGRCPAYSPTPVREVSTEEGIRTLIKDETNRFNLGAFKALGGIYAVIAFLQDRWQQENNADLDPAMLFEEKMRSWSNKFTFVCASAGNHGMAVAKGAQLVNANSRVYLCETVPESFSEKLEALNTEVVRSGRTYEDSMLAAQEFCEASDVNIVLLSDSSWPGFTDMPSLVMEGYTVMAEELRQNFLASNKWPSHVFLQAGVGGLAAAITYSIRKSWAIQPQIIVVEPSAAPCLFESVKCEELTAVEGPVSTMGRLDCKQASLLAFRILYQYADKFVLVNDADAGTAVSFLAENGIVTTPSGSAGVAAILQSQRLGIHLPDSATCLALATEGPV